MTAPGLTEDTHEYRNGGYTGRLLSLFDAGAFCVLRTKYVAHFIDGVGFGGLELTVPCGRLYQRTLP